jgi:LemA protein
MSVAATIVVLLVAALWGLAIYKRLVRLRTAVRKAWSRLETQRTRRLESITLIASAVTPAATVERQTIDAVAAAAQQAAASRGPADAAARDESLTAALTRLLSALENAPADPRLQDLRRDLAAVDSAVAEARTSYNDAAASYNRAIAAAPDSLVAGLAGFAKAERFETRRT